MRPALAELFSLALLLSGCLGGEKPATDPTPTGSDSSEDPTTVDPGVTDGSSPPVWQVGMFWEYDVAFVFPDLDYTERFVVYDEDETNWYVTTINRELNLLSEFAHYPTLGAVRKSDLAGTIHGFEIPFLKFPLEDGLSWDAAYRTADGAWTARSANFTIGNDEYPAFDVSMTATSGEAANYTYVPELGWYGQLEMGFGGPPSVTMTLTASGWNNTAEVHPLSFTDLVHRAFPVRDENAVPPAVPAEEPHATFTVAEGTSLAWGVFYGGAPGDYAVLTVPEGSPQAANPSKAYSKSDAGVSFDWGEDASPPTGAWDVTASGSTEGPGFLFVEFLEVRET